MSNIVTIRPRSGSRSFTGTKGSMIQYQKITENGQDLEKSDGEYKGERFPNSRQIIRPVWRSSKRRWGLHGFMDKMDAEKQKALDKLVKACKYKYSEGHPKALQYIETADVFDMGDPFFNHKSLKTMPIEGQITLDKDVPADNLLLRSLMVNVEYQKGGETSNSMLSNRVRYVITDSDVDAKVKKVNRSKKIESVDLYKALTADKKLKVAMAMGIISNENVDSAIVDEVVWDASQSGNLKFLNSLTKQDLFIKLCKSNPETLNLKYKIQKAKSKGKLKRNKTQGWLLMGQPVGKTLQKVEEYLSNDDNTDVLLRLEEMLDEK